jgi:hypothetical protein
LNRKRQLQARAERIEGPHPENLGHFQVFIADVDLEEDVCELHRGFDNG